MIERGLGFHPFIGLLMVITFIIAMIYIIYDGLFKAFKDKDKDKEDNNKLVLYHHK